MFEETEDIETEETKTEKPYDTRKNVGKRVQQCIANGTYADGKTPLQYTDEGKIADGTAMGAGYKPGQCGNPNGQPTIHRKKMETLAQEEFEAKQEEQRKNKHNIFWWIREFVEGDTTFIRNNSEKETKRIGNVAKSLATKLITEALDGDKRSMELVLKYAEKSENNKLPDKSESTIKVKYV